MLDAVLKRIAPNLHGAVATEEDVRFLTARLDKGLVPDWLMALLATNRLAGMCFSLNENDDMSKMGAEVIWLTPIQVFSEAAESQPGISVTPLGYIPFGACAQGSGDPYFLDMRKATDDPPVVRVPHDFAGHGPYPLDRIEMVAKSLSGFFDKATL